MGELMIVSRCTSSVIYLLMFNPKSPRDLTHSHVQDKMKENKTAGDGRRLLIIYHTAKHSATNLHRNCAAVKLLVCFIYFILFYHFPRVRAHWTVSLHFVSTGRFNWRRFLQQAFG